MDTQNKVTVKRVKKMNGDCFYKLFKDDTLVECWFFDESASPESVMYEESVRSKALAFAATLEKGKLDIEEIIYQTPEN